MSIALTLGNVVELTFEVRNTVTGALATPSGGVTLKIKLPDGTTLTPTPTNPSTGNYAYDYTPTLEGIHNYRYEGTGTNATAEEGQFTVKKSKVI